MYLLVNTSTLVRKVPLKDGFLELAPRESAQVDKDALDDNIVRLLKSRRIPGVSIFDLAEAKVIKQSKPETKKEAKAEPTPVEQPAEPTVSDVSIQDELKIVKEVPVEESPTLVEESSGSSEKSETIDITIPDEKPKRKRRRKKKSE